MRTDHRTSPSFWERQLGWKGRAVGGGFACGMGWGMTMLLDRDTGWPSWAILVGFIACGAIGGIMISRPKRGL